MPKRREVELPAQRENPPLDFSPRTLDGLTSAVDEDVVTAAVDEEEEEAVVVVVVVEATARGSKKSGIGGGGEEKEPPPGLLPLSLLEPEEGSGERETPEDAPLGGR